MRDDYDYHRQIARDALKLIVPMGGHVVTKHGWPFEYGIASLLKIARKRHARYWATHAELAEQVDAPVSNTGGREAVRVRSPRSAWAPGVPERTSTSYVEGPSSILGEPVLSLADRKEPE